MISFGRQVSGVVQALVQGGVLLLLAAVVALSVNQLRPGGLPLVGDWSPGRESRIAPRRSRTSLFLGFRPVPGRAIPGSIRGGPHRGGAQPALAELR